MGVVEPPGSGRWPGQRLQGLNHRQRCAHHLSRAPGRLRDQSRPRRCVGGHREGVLAFRQQLRDVRVPQDARPRPFDAPCRPGLYRAGAWCMAPGGPGDCGVRSAPARQRRGRRSGSRAAPGLGRSRASLTGSRAAPSASFREDASTASTAASSLQTHQRPPGRP